MMPCFPEFTINYAQLAADRGLWGQFRKLRLACRNPKSLWNWRHFQGHLRKNLESLRNVEILQLLPNSMESLSNTAIYYQVDKNTLKIANTKQFKLSG